ncbi:MAG: hypothetical protein Q9181_005969 [Wetmoreana brouardii]
MPSPFPPSASTLGTGKVHLTLRPPNDPVFETLFYTYPLKLVVSAAHSLPSPKTRSPEDAKTPSHPSSVPLLFLLTYGGGLVSGDHISLSISLSPSTRLTLTTQGSTKIFRPPSHPAPLTRQDLTVRIAANAALCLMPDPCQPFASSRYAQTQVFEVDVNGGGSLCMLDWVCEGRSARGEKWAFEAWRGRNEIWDVSASPSPSSPSTSPNESGVHQKDRRKLVLRDSLILSSPNLTTRVSNLSIFGTLILYGPLLSSFSNFFIEEFKALPRIGARDWSSHSASSSTSNTNPSPNVPPSANDQAPTTETQTREQWRKQRQEREKKDGVLWTAASVRGAVVVKFGSREMEGARVWLGGMMREEGTVGREFGPGALFCVK